MTCTTGWRLELGVLQHKPSQVHERATDYQIGTGSSGARAPDYATRIDFCRSKIREREHLKFDRKCNLSNIQGERLHPNTVTVLGWHLSINVTVTLIDKCLDLKKQYIDNVICNDNFVTAPNPKSDFTSLLWWYMYNKYLSPSRGGAYMQARRFVFEVPIFNGLRFRHF